MRISAGWWLGLIALSACIDSPDGPVRPPTSLIAVGDTAHGRFPVGGDEFRFEFPASNNSPYAVFLQTLGSPIGLFAGDTTGTYGLASIRADPGLHLLDRATDPFQFGNSPVLLLVDGTDSGAFRLVVTQVHEEPESRGARFVVGDTVSESLETLADIDTFVVAGLAGQEVVGYAEALNGSSPGDVSLGIEALAGVGGAAGDTDLQQASTGRFVFPSSRDYRVTLRSGRDASGYRQYRGPYRFQLRAINTAPEHHAATIAVGDTVAGESIDYVGDVDAFTVAGAPGQEGVVFLQGRTGNAAGRFELDVLDSAGGIATNVLSGGSDPDLLGQMTARFRIPATGPAQVRLRVSGVDDHTIDDRGAYRFWVYPINLPPEAAGATLTFGDSVFNETIDVPGDVDEFHVTVPDSSGVNLAAQTGLGASGGSLDAILLDSAGHPVVVTASQSAVEATQNSTMIGPGSYTLRVQESATFDGRSPFRGSYRIWLYAFGLGPEVARDTIAIGDTITTEALHPPGDVDVFHLPGVKGQHVIIALAGQGTLGGIVALAFGPVQGPDLWFLQSPTSGDPLGAHRSARIDLDSTGLYEIRIGGNGPTGPTLTDAGPYVFAVTAADTLPELVARNVAVGDTVAGSIDYLGDYDSYAVTGTAGQTIAVSFQTLASANFVPALELDDIVTGDSLAAVLGNPTPTFTVPVTLPPSGQIALRVREVPPGRGGGYFYVGGYRFVVASINLAPENVPSTFALGDTVRGEAIFPAGDIDEFTSTGTPGATLVPFSRLTADPVPAGSLITVEIVDPATGVVLAGTGVAASGASAQFGSPGAFVVPGSGTYLVRVRAYDRNLATAPYEFFVSTPP